MGAVPSVAVCSVVGSSYIAGREEQIRQLGQQIERWDVRLELRETALRRQFSNLESTLGRMQQQGQWLAGQLASLQPPR
jgi:flagellar hook-associated protein 2